METRKETFKVLIKEFHGWKSPLVIKRNLRLPEWCYEIPSAGQRTARPGFVVTITGPRRAGKTFFFYQIMEKLLGASVSPLPRNRILYINFEDARLLPLDGADLTLLLEAYYDLYPDNRGLEIYVFLDEIHLVDGWDSFIQKLLETPGIRVFITGSSSMSFSPAAAGIRPGRALSVELFPLDFREYLCFKGLEITDESANNGDRFKIRYLLDEFLAYGGYPEVVLADLPAKPRVLRNYYDILVYKDMVDRFAIRNAGLLKGLLKHLVTRVGSSVSLNAYYLGLLPKNRVSRETVMDYVSYFQQNGLISLIPMFSDSEKTRRVNPRRVYCLDNGMRNAVSFNLVQDEERLAKNAVYGALKRTGREIFYWKDAGDVDFIARRDGKLEAINVSYGLDLTPDTPKSLLEFRRATGEAGSTLTIITKDAEMKASDVDYVPLWKWLFKENVKIS